MDDFMELGESGLVPLANGWFYEKNTGKYIDPDGKPHDKIEEVENESEED